MTAGNHDSGQRLAFARELLARQNVHIAGTVDKELIHVTLSDSGGPVTFWLMPYVFPAAVARVLGDDTIHDYDTAIRRLLDAQHKGLCIHEQIALYNLAQAMAFLNGLRGVPLRVEEVRR